MRGSLHDTLVLANTKHITNINVKLVFFKVGYKLVQFKIQLGRNEASYFLRRVDQNSVKTLRFPIAPNFQDIE